jgi:hypothetical protein
LNYLACLFDTSAGGVCENDLFSTPSYVCDLLKS